MSKITNMISDSLNKINDERDRTKSIIEQREKAIEKSKKELSEARKKFIDYAGSEDIYLFIEKKSKDGAILLSNKSVRSFMTWDEIKMFEQTDNRYILHANLSDAEMNEVKRREEHIKWVLKYMPQIIIATSGNAKTNEEIFDNLCILGSICSEFEEKFQASPIDFIIIVNRIKENMKHNINYL